MFKDTSIRSSVVILGRVGSCDFINGTYDEDKKLRKEDGCPVFARAEPVPDNEQPLLLFHDAVAEAWCLAFEVGSRAVVAYIAGK